MAHYQWLGCRMHRPGKQRHIHRSLYSLLGLLLGHYDTQENRVCHSTRYSCHLVYGHLIKLLPCDRRKQ